MHKSTAATLAALPAIAAGALFYGQSSADAKATEKQVTEAGYVCPVTGELLPCEKCCQLNK
jgi:hypothetical protein